MRPSISVTLEPGLERGVPWGRDLYTFVTSAAGHMMRTLQKPRKNRPSKRQVNHRRFLHNMIQRKFADIEAANHRLASALYFKEEETSLPSHKPELLDQSGSPSRGDYLQDPDKRSVLTGADGVSKSRSDFFETDEKKQPDSRHLWKRHPKSQLTTCTPKKNNQSKGGQREDSGNQKQVELTSVSSPIDYNHGQELFNSEYSDDSLLKSANNLSDDSQTTQQDSGFIPLGQNVDISPVFSPELSPLSLDSCDFSIQMFTDISSCSQVQKNIADLSESQWTDIMDLFSSGNKDLGGCTDVESHIESFCACQEDAGQDVGACDVGFADQSDSFTEGICSNRSEVEDLHCQAGDYRYQYGYSCHGDQGVTVSHFQRQNEEAAETLFHSFRPSQDITQNQAPPAISCHYNASELYTHQHPQGESPCALANNQNFTPFMAVAQSFPVPLHNPEHRPIPTLPQEDDWLFTDILKDRKSPDC